MKWPCLDSEVFNYDLKRDQTYKGDTIHLRGQRTPMQITAVQSLALPGHTAHPVPASPTLSSTYKVMFKISYQNYNFIQCFLIFPLLFHLYIFLLYLKNHYPVFTIENAFLNKNCVYLTTYFWVFDVFLFTLSQINHCPALKPHMKWMESIQCISTCYIYFW